jgi:FtsH-binding integral membrane protein
LANKFQHQLDAMTDQQRDKYRKTQLFAYAAGLVSLLSFWILVLINRIIPWGGASYGMGRDARLMEWAPLGFLMAIGGLAISLVLRSQCRRMREAALYSVKNEKSDQA